MAAIDIVGTTVIVNAAGTMDAAFASIEILSASVWWASTLGDIQIVDINTASLFVRRFSVDRSGVAPFSEYVAMEGRYGRLSFNVVTAGTLTFNFA